MGLLGKLIAAPVRLVNAPFRAIELLVDPENTEDSKILSVPLEAVAKALEEIVPGSDS